MSSEKTTFEFTLPRLLSKDAVNIDLGSGPMIIMNLNFILNFFFKAFMNTILGAVQSLSIITHMFVISLDYPLELTNFFGQLFTLVTFDIVPYIDEIFDYGFNFQLAADDKPLNEYFEAVGYEYTLSIKNFGSMFLIICSLPVYMLALFLLENFCFTKRGRLRSRVQAARKSLYFNDLIKATESSLVVLAVVCLI